jgi:hypothetical protein
MNEKSSDEYCTYSIPGKIFRLFFLTEFSLHFSTKRGFTDLAFGNFIFENYRIKTISWEDSISALYYQTVIYDSKHSYDYKENKCEYELDSNGNIIPKEYIDTYHDMSEETKA